MTSPVDTSTEAVQRELNLLRARLAGHGAGDTAWSMWAERTIALIEALLAEREALRAKCEAWQDEANRRTREVEMTYIVQKRLTAERDAMRAALAQIEEMAAARRAALEEAAEVCEEQRKRWPEWPAEIARHQPDVNRSLDYGRRQGCDVCAAALRLLAEGGGDA